MSTTSPASGCVNEPGMRSRKSSIFSAGVITPTVFSTVDSLREMSDRCTGEGLPGDISKFGESTGVRFSMGEYTPSPELFGISCCGPLSTCCCCCFSVRKGMEGKKPGMTGGRGGGCSGAKSLLPSSVGSSGL